MAATAFINAASNETVLITLAMTATIARTMDEHVVILGAGPAGLAAAWAVRRAGRDPLVVEQADVVGASPAGPGHHRVTARQRCSVPGHAAVDGQCHAGDVGRGGAGQEHHHRVNLMLLAHAPEG